MPGTTSASEGTSDEHRGDHRRRRRRDRAGGWSPRTCTAIPTCSSSSASACSAWRGCSSPTSPRCPRPGDYVVRRVLDDSFIVVRDERGRVRVHFNMCLHRGMQVCRAEVGNASHFRCPYHGWSYRNDGRLAGLPFHHDAYGGDDGLVADGAAPAARAPRRHRRRADLRQPRRRRTDPARVTRRLRLLPRPLHAPEPRGLELRGPQRWRVQANWKIGCENFVGDMYHTPYTHRSVVDIGLFREPKANKRKEGVLYFAGAGGGTTYKLPPGDFRSRMRYVGYPDEMIDRAAATWSAEQVAMVGDDGFMVSAATLFPNLSFVHNWPQVDDAGTVVPFISIRQWQPVSADGDRGAVVVRRRPQRARAVQGRLVPRLPDVLRLVGDVRAGRRRELGVDHQGLAGDDGAAAAAQQPHGSDVRRRADQPAPRRASPGRARPGSASASSTSATG